MFHSGRQEHIVPTADVETARKGDRANKWTLRPRGGQAEVWESFWKGRETTDGKGKGDH